MRRSGCSQSIRQRSVRLEKMLPLAVNLNGFFLICHSRCFRRVTQQGETQIPVAPNRDSGDDDLLGSPLF